MSLGVASPQELHNVRVQEEQALPQGPSVFWTGGGMVGKTPCKRTDLVNSPAHYTSHPSGVECITITEHMGFNLGNVLKYIWRADLKTQVPIQDLEKAAWYLNREIQRRGR